MFVFPQGSLGALFLVRRKDFGLSEQFAIRRLHLALHVGKGPFSAGVGALASATWTPKEATKATTNNYYT